MSIVVEEVDETAFWLEILSELRIADSIKTINWLKEIFAIVAKARKMVSNK